MSSGESSQILRKRTQLSGAGFLANSRIILLRLKSASNLSRQSLRTPRPWQRETRSTTQGELNCTVGSQPSWKRRTLVVRSSSCRRREAISLRTSRLFSGIRSSSLSTAVRWEMSARDARSCRQRSFALSDAPTHRITLPSSAASSRRSSLSRLQSQGSRFSNFGFRESSSRSAFSTSRYPRCSAVVCAKRSAPTAPQAMNLKYSFLVIGVPASYSMHFSWVIRRRSRWQSYSPSSSSRKELSKSLLLRASKPQRDSVSISAAKFLGKVRQSLIYQTNSCSSTSTSSSLPSRSRCNSTPSARVIFAAISLISSQTSSSAGLGFSRKRLMRLLRDFDSVSRASTLRRRQLQGQLMRSMRVRVVWMAVMVALFPGCSFSESCPHSRTTRSFRSSLLRSSPTSPPTSSFPCTASISCSVSRWLSSATEISSKLSSSRFHPSNAAQSSAMRGQEGRQWAQRAMRFSFSRRLPVGLISWRSMALLKYQTMFSQNCSTVSRYFSSKKTQFNASLCVSARASAIASF